MADFESSALPELKVRADQIIISVLFNHQPSSLAWLRYLVGVLKIFEPDSTRNQTPRAAKPLTLRRNFSWAFIGNMVYAACQWGMLVVFAKLGTPEMLGQFTLGLAVTAPVILFSNLQLRAIQATDARQQYHFGDYLGLRLLTTGLALLVIVGLIFAGGYQGETAGVIFLVALAKAIESISDVFYGFMQQHEQMDRVAQSMMLRGLFSLLALMGGVYLVGNAVGGTIGVSLAWAIILIVYDIPKSQEIIFHRSLLGLNDTDKRLDVKLYPDWHLKTLLKLSGVTLPLGFVMMIISLNTNLPRYFIEQHLGQRELGIFAAMAYLQVAGTTVVGALGQAASPRLAKYYVARDRKAFWQLLLKLLLVGVGLGVGGVLLAIVAGRQILTLLYQAEYAKNSTLFVWIMVAAGLGYIVSVLGYAATAQRRIRYQPIVLSVSLLVSFILCDWLVPTQGLWGAVISTVVTSIVSLLGYSLLIYKPWIAA